VKLKVMDIDLLVPCRRFSIDYSYTDKRQLPILSEYALKLCYELESVSSSTLCDFFGISKFEASVLIDRLEKDSLVRFHHESIELTPYCRQRFDEAGGDTTRFFEYKDDSEVIAMELNNYGILPSSSKNIRDSWVYGLQIVDDQALVDVSNKATIGFSKNYSYYLKEYKSEEILTTQNELYKVGNISVMADGLLQIGAGVYIDSRKKFMLTTEIANAEIYENIDTDYLCDQLDQNTVVDDHGGGDYKGDLMCHCDIFDDAFIDEFTASDKRFDLGRALNAYAGKWLYPDQSTATVIGYHYNEENRLRISSLIEAACQDSSSCQIIGPAESLMVVNSYSAAWGRSSMLYEFGRQVAIPRYSLLGNIKPDQINDVKQFFYRFSQPSSLEKQVFSNGSFCLFSPGRFAIAQYYFPHPSTSKLYIPIGYVTTNADKLDRIAEAFSRELRRGVTIGRALARKHERDLFDPGRLQKFILDWISSQSYKSISEGEGQ